MEVESHVLHWTCFSNSLLQRPQPHARTTPARGWGESVPRLWYRWLAFPVLLICCLLGLVKLGRGLKENAGHSYHQNLLWDTWEKTVGEWYHCHQAPIPCLTEDKKTHGSSARAHEPYMFHWVLEPSPLQW